MRSRCLPRFVLLVLAVLLLAACSGSSDEAADTTLAPTTTAPTTTTVAPTTTAAATTTTMSLSTAEAIELVDGFIAAWNSGDPAAVALVLADEFSFKGGPYEQERTDMESLASWLEALAPLEPHMERTGDLTVDESGRISFQTHITSKEIDRIAAMEAEAQEGRITRWVTLDWEKP